VNIASKLASYIVHLNTAPLRVIQPHLAWIRLSRLPAMTNQDDIAALTPARWKPVS
jgi:hypothetical protein